MENNIQFELVSPEEKLVSQPVHMAVIPGDEGEFGVLAGHASLVASLRPGVVELYEQAGGEARKIFIAGGFADVSAEQCTVLAEEAVLVSDLDQTKIEQKIADLNEDLGIAEEAADKARIEKRLVLLKAKLSAVTGKLAA
ncbi:MAG TPA: ATP synthase F1 subunit epsilon [Alphaproteobacteria bacterium]|nr:ATP synthase F1 subunit epsilon [Alphaproteobacteria bacterium]USO05846.1 MAG: ATP synthase F1 subunit epsilon [Rhodospirillales bacterium]HOO82444.1 ATP synthase F1 subunit epsilon [Alphaproteobacteria bacterium]